MVLYKCPRCGYNTTQKSDIRKHFLRKNPCRILLSECNIQDCFFKVLGDNYHDYIKNNNLNININDTPPPPPPPPQKLINSINILNSEISTINSLKCNYCNKLFTRKDNLLRHSKKCKIHLNSSQSFKNETFSSNENETFSAVEVEELLNKEREKTSYIIKELKSQIEVLLKNQGSNNTHTTNYNIMVNSFGKENLDYISKDYINNIINNGPLSSIPTLLKYIHFNPEHKENHNVKISNKKLNYAQIFNGINWEYRDKNMTIENMSDRAYQILNNHYVSGTSNYMDNFKQQYDECNKILYKRVFKDIELMVLNNHKIL